jgi:hypothetical protein
MPRLRACQCRLGRHAEGLRLAARRLRSGKASPAAPAGEEWCPHGRALRVASCPPRGPLRLRSGKASPAAPAGLKKRPRHCSLCVAPCRPRGPLHLRTRSARSALRLGETHTPAVALHVAALNHRKAAFRSAQPPSGAAGGVHTNPMFFSEKFLMFGTMSGRSVVLAPNQAASVAANWSTDVLGRSRPWPTLSGPVTSMAGARP